MKKIISLVSFFCALNALAQKVEIAAPGESWAEISVQQTQSELKPGWQKGTYLFSASRLPKTKCSSIMYSSA